MVRMHIRRLKLLLQNPQSRVYMYPPTHPYHKTSSLPTTDTHETVSDSPPDLLTDQRRSFLLKTGTHE
jgi:hypothetical protein